MAKALGVQALNFTRLIPEGTGARLVESGGDRVLEGLELKNSMIGILESSVEFGVRTGTDQPLYALIDKNLGANGNFGFQGVIVDYQGNLKVSSRADLTLGNILTDGLEELFLNHPVMRKLRRGDIEGCGTCPFYSRCGGDRNASYAATGSFLKADPGCWRIHKKTSPRRAV